MSDLLSTLSQDVVFKQQPNLSLTHFFYLIKFNVIFHNQILFNQACYIKFNTWIHPLNFSSWFLLCLCSWGIRSVWWHALHLRKPAHKHPLLIQSLVASPPASNVAFFPSSTRSNRRDQSLSSPSDLTHTSTHSHRHALHAYTYQNVLYISNVQSRDGIRSKTGGWKLSENLKQVIIKWADAKKIHPLLAHSQTHT